MGGRGGLRWLPGCPASHRVCFARAVGAAASLAPEKSRTVAQPTGLLPHISQQALRGMGGRSKGSSGFGAGREQSRPDICNFFFFLIFSSKTCIFFFTFAYNAAGLPASPLGKEVETSRLTSVTLMEQLQS